MSVVACKIHPSGDVTLAADSISVRGYTQRKNSSEEGGKLFELNNDSGAIGGVGAVQELNLLRIFLDNYTIVPKQEKPSERHILDMLNAFVRWLKDKYGAPATLSNAYIIALQGGVFATCGWEISRVAEFEAIGAGMDFALAALALGETAERAVEVATELSVFCEKPLQVYHISPDVVNVPAA